MKLDPHKVWFTSDTHWAHTRVLELCKRPFGTIQEMDNALIHNWNAVVPQDGIVFHLGDFNLGGVISSTIRKRLNGTIHLSPGNHEVRALREPELWASIDRRFEINVGGQEITLSHYPHLVWLNSHKESWSLHGHCHGSLPDDPHSLRLDVGVDSWGYTPVSMHQLRARMATKQYKPVDHHKPHEEIS